MTNSSALLLEIKCTIEATLMDIYSIEIISRCQKTYTISKTSVVNECVRSLPDRPCSLTLDHCNQNHMWVSVSEGSHKRGVWIFCLQQTACMEHTSSGHFGMKTWVRGKSSVLLHDPRFMRRCLARSCLSAEMGKSYRGTRELYFFSADFESSVKVPTVIAFNVA